MAKIREYNSQSSLRSTPLGVRRTGDHYGAQTGRSLQKFGRALSADANRRQQRDVQEERLTANRNLSELQMKYTKKWDDAARNASPENSDFHDSFLEEFEEDLSKFGENLSTKEGRDHYETGALRLRYKFQESARAVQAELKGIKAKNDYKVSQDNFTSSLVSDPSAFEVTLDLHNQGVDGMVESGLLPPNKAAELKRDGQKKLALSAIKGWAKQDPSKTKADLKSGKWDAYLDGNSKYQMIEEAEREMRARVVEGERLEALEKKVKRERNNRIRAEFGEKLITYSLTAKEIMDSDLPPIGPGSKKTFIDVLKRQSKATFDATDPALYNDTLEKIHNGELTDETELLEYAYGNGLSQDDVAFLSREIRALKVQPNSIESKMKKKLVDEAKKRISRTNVLAGVYDVGGEDRVHKFSAFMNQEYENGIKAGKTPMELLDPESPHYLGKFISQFQKNDKEIMSDLATEKRQKERVSGFNKKQKEAYSWALKNKHDPRSKEILKRLGFGGEN